MTQPLSDYEQVVGDSNRNPYVPSDRDRADRLVADITGPGKPFTDTGTLQMPPDSRSTR